MSLFDGVDYALSKEVACRLFDLPEDREADIVVISKKDVCIGSSIDNHDLAGLNGVRLRTHGGIAETNIPFILNRELNDLYRSQVSFREIKSYDIFEFAINGVK